MHLAQALCWVAATLFDFKGCLEPHLDALQFFSGDTAVCLHTSISYVCMYVCDYILILFTCKYRLR